MEFQRLAIPDVVLVRPRVFGDARGYFFESWEARKFAAAGLEIKFVQDNCSRSVKDTLRGLHYQIKQPQGKLVQVTDGEVFDVAVDIRRSSPTFGKWVGTILSGENKHQLWVPPGFAHGFCVLSESADFFYKCSDFYAPEHERTLRWDDPALGIDWRLKGTPLLSPKDQQGKLLADADCFPVKVLVTGAGGQVATALQKLKPAGIELISLGHAELDITHRETLRRRVAILDPDVIINAAAYTAVDKAESDLEMAVQVNGAAPGYLAEAAYANGARLLHISTDFVFDGKADSPYRPDAATAPQGIYGLSKLQGEQRALEASHGQALVLRTAWVYAAKGHNFVLTMLRLMGDRGAVKVVQDQRGSPTWADSVARALWAATDKPQFRGLHHWTDAGVASWYDFAVAIAEEGRALGLLTREVEVLPIGSAEYPTPARRPVYSVLDCTSTEAGLALKAQPWRDNLKKMLMELKDA